MVAIHHPWVFTFGLLGNIISFMVFLAPVSTFIRIYKKKSTEGFHSVPYVIAIFSCMLWIYYALLKGNTLLLITINSVGIVIETIYIVIFLTYAPKQSKISTLRLLLLLNFAGFSVIVLLCHYLAKGATRVQVFGWICVAFSISVFAAPLSIMRKVIRTKSVEYMPFNLSFCLTLTAIIWFMYGLLKKDLYITLPNVGGFIFGVAQMILYGIYRKYDKQAEKEKLPKQLQVSSSAKQSSVEIHPINSPLSGAATPPSQPAPHQEITEVMVGIPENEEGTIVNEDLPKRQPPQQALLCHVDVEDVVGGATRAPAAPAQLVECAV